MFKTRSCEYLIQHVLIFALFIQMLIQNKIPIDNHLVAATSVIDVYMILFIPGGQKHHVTLELAQEDHDSTVCVSQLMKEVARVTEVPVKNQRLIVKGLQVLSIVS